MKAKKAKWVERGVMTIDKRTEPKKAKWVELEFRDHMPTMPTGYSGHYECEAGYISSDPHATTGISSTDTLSPPDCFPNGSDLPARGRGSASGTR